MRAIKRRLGATFIFVSPAEAAALANKVKSLESPKAGFRPAGRSLNVNVLPNNQNTKLASGGVAKPIPPDKFKSNILKGDEAPSSAALSRRGVEFDRVFFQWLLGADYDCVGAPLSEIVVTV